MGARMAKITLHIVVASVFASCCPLILIFAWLYCTIGSLSYGYLLIYAETKKPDMGGSFWVKSLRHLFAGLAIYVLLMVARLRLVLSARLLTLPGSRHSQVGLLSRACGPSREAPLVAALAFDSKNLCETCDHRCLLVILRDTETCTCSCSLCQGFWLSVWASTASPH